MPTAIFHECIVYKIFDGNKLHGIMGSHKDIQNGIKGMALNWIKVCKIRYHRLVAMKLLLIHLNLINFIHSSVDLCCFLIVYWLIELSIHSFCK